MPADAAVHVAGTAQRPVAVILMAISLILAVGAALAGIGADARWLAALGRTIVARGGVPTGVPFAAAPSSHWHNVPVLAELAFHWLESGLGDRGLLIAQLLAVAVALSVLSRDALRAGATADGAAAAILLCSLGAVPSLVLIRSQLFSLALFPVLVALLRDEARRPSRRIWLLVPLLALWSNLHGAVLVGLAVAFAYLLLSRAREAPRTAMAVLVASVLALGLTPALAGTAAYYQGVLDNVAAQRGVALWAPLSLASPFDDLALLAVVMLAWLARESPLRLWEKIALVGLAALSVKTARADVWLLFFLVGPAARAIRRRREWGWLAPVTAVVASVILVVAVIGGPREGVADGALLNRAIALSGGSPILAPDPLAERIALAGGRIWLGNPLDAFATGDQAAYLDWAEGSPDGSAALVAPVRVVLAGRASAAARLMDGLRSYRRVDGDRATVVYLRRP